jgi:outer membrane receptor protein involved in Fe transport
LDPVFSLVEALVSIPKSQVWGVESSVAAKPIKGLDLSASVTYLETKVQNYSGYNANSQLENYAGSAFPYSPKWESVADARYAWDVGVEKRLFIGANITEHSASYASIGIDPNFQLPAYTLLGARAGIEASDDKWRVTFWGNNVTNKYYWTGVEQYWDTRFRIAAMPATYGVRFQYNY